ncbi:hypothetical protein [Paraconexibacter sp. AEG42_29]|uniref:hypothetical protein n=1 Tax=Paraconexibacter sp. AEG42_29 TaxID=2997339 RepID=UPI00339D4AD4
MKSRPELWSEVSDPDALGRHLGEFGEITITRLEPETTVAWEGTAARGTVELEASGWGTKVTLTAELVESAPATPAVPAPTEPTAAPPALDVPAHATGARGGTSSGDGGASAPAPAVETGAERAAEPSPAAAPAVVPEPQAPTPPTAAAERSAARQAASARPPAHRAPKQGFLSRLFGRKAAAPPPVSVRAETPPADPPPLRVVPDPEPEPQVIPIKPATPGPEPDPDPPLVAEAAPGAVAVPEVAPTPVRVVDGERAVEVLTAALDDLGAAHRRPFSHT